MTVYLCGTRAGGGGGGRKEKNQKRHWGGREHGDNLVQLQVRRPDRRPATIPRWPSESSVRRRYFWCGDRGGAQSICGSLALDAEAPEGWTTRVCGRRAGGGQVPSPRAAREERPVVFCWPPQRGTGQPGCRVGTGVQARERERENTETALVEVQGGQASLQTPSPAPCCPTLA